MPYVIRVYILLSSVNIVALDDLDLGFSVDLPDAHGSSRRDGPILSKENHCLTAPFCLVLSELWHGHGIRETTFLSSVRSITNTRHVLVQTLECVQVFYVGIYF